MFSISDLSPFWSISFSLLVTVCQVNPRDSNEDDICDNGKSETTDYLEIYVISIICANVV
jgi:hypothetical protein